MTGFCMHPEHTPCIGIELDPDYFQVACARLQQEVEATQRCQGAALAEAAD